MKNKAMSGTMLVTVALVVIVLISFAVWIGQTREETEKGVFGKFMDWIYPKRIEQVTIPGTAVGGGKLVLSEKEADGMNQLAAAVVGCYRTGMETNKDSSSFKCADIDFSKAKYTLSEKSFQSALDAQGDLGKTVKDDGFPCGARYEWKIKPDQKTVIICYDYESVGIGDSCSDVYITGDISDCKEEASWIVSKFK